MADNPQCARGHDATTMVIADERAHGRALYRCLTCNRQVVLDGDGHFHAVERGGDITP